MTVRVSARHGTVEPMRIIVLFTLLCAPLYALRIVKLPDGKGELHFEERNGKEALVKVVRDQKTYSLLAPDGEPPLALDGDRFVELGGHNYAPNREWLISPTGKLSQNKDGKPYRPINGYDLEEERKVRTQLQRYLFSLPREQRLINLSGTEQFLLDNIAIAENSTLSPGITSGARVGKLEDQRGYLVAGEKRYPGILSRGNKAYYWGDDKNRIYEILQNKSTLAIKDTEQRNPRKEEPIPKLGHQAYTLFVLDQWDDFDLSEKKNLLPVIAKGLDNNGTTIEMSFDEGTFPKDLASVALVDDLKRPLTQEGIQTRAISYALNFIGKNPVATPPGVVKKGNKRTIDVTPFLSVEKLGRLLRRNPYACSPSEIGHVRLDWFLSHIQKDDVYREVMSIPPTLGGAVNEYGIQGEFAPLSKDNLNVGIDISAVANGARVANLQPQKKKNGKPFYQTFDFATDLKGNLQNKNSDFKRHPSGFPHTAGEYIFGKQNDYLGFVVYRPKKDAPVLSPEGKLGFVSLEGETLFAAPDSVITDSETKFGPFIHNPRSCLHCHENGLRSASDLTPGDPDSWMVSEKDFENEEALKKEWKTYAAYTDAIKKHFGKAETFVKEAAKHTQSYHAAVKKSGAFVSRDGETLVGLLPHFFFEYHKKLTLEQAAKELGTDVASLQKALDSSVRTDVGRFSYNRQEGLIDRLDFEQAFCDIKRTIAWVKNQQEGAQPANAPDH